MPRGPFITSIPLILRVFSPPLHYTWKRGEEALSGVQESSGDLILPVVLDEDAGDYVCVVRNEAGQCSSQAMRLHVLAALPSPVKGSKAPPRLG